MKKNNWFSASLEDTKQIAIELASLISPGDVVCFHGTLGAGKTTLIKSLVHCIAAVDENMIHSPTFTYLIEYKNSSLIYHFDLYRLKDPEEFESMGFIDYFSNDHICLIEWPERITPYLPDNALHVYIDYSGENNRRITLK